MICLLLYEYCFLDKFQSLLTTDDNQFGFRKGRGCTHSIYACRNIGDYFVSSGNTVNICALDLSKAFDKVNHQALFIKLMKRNIPVPLLSLIENLFCCCSSCIKWNIMHGLVYFKLISLQISCNSIWWCSKSIPMLYSRRVAWLSTRLVVTFPSQGRRRRYGHGRTNNPTDNVWPKLTRSPAVAETVGQKLAVTYIAIVATTLQRATVSLLYCHSFRLM